MAAGSRGFDGDAWARRQFESNRIGCGYLVKGRNPASAEEWKQESSGGFLGGHEVAFSGNFVSGCFFDAVVCICYNCQPADFAILL